MTSNQSAEPHGTYLVLGLLIAAGAIMFLWLAPRNQDTESEEDVSEAAAREFAPNPVKQPAAPAQPQTAPRPQTTQAAEPEETQAAAPQAPTQDVEANDDKPDDLFAGPMPEFMDRIYKRVSDNKWLNAHDQKQLYDYGKEHPDDARPQLILAWDARNRDWDGIAARMYRIAYTADERAKDDPSMLPDLLSIAARHDNVEFKDASSLIADAYGAQALPEIEDEIDLATRRKDTGRVGRLNRLRDEIRSH